MDKRTIDYFTVAGLAIFVILGIIYLTWDHISQINLNLSLDPSSVNISLPFGIPDFNMDWFNTMDPASRIIFCFVMTILLGTLIGGTWMYLVHRKRTGAK
jgi:hypothetical protein